MRSNWSVQVRTFFLTASAKGGAKGREPSQRRHRAIFDHRDIRSISEEEEVMAVAESWTKKYLAEVLGTFVLVFLGDSFVAFAVAGAGGNGFKAGLLAAGLFLGFAGTLAIYTAGAVSGAHLNPAVTVALAWRRGFPWSKVPGYIGSQLVGAFIAAAAITLVWDGIILKAEHAANIVRGGGNRSV